jgi:hypothetical protein
MPRIVSPGLSAAKKTVSLACAPEWGWTLAALAAAVVALAREPFRVLVGQLRPLGRHHGRARVVLRGDQLDVIFLATIFGVDGFPDF